MLHVITTLTLSFVGTNLLSADKMLPLDNDHIERAQKTFICENSQDINTIFGILPSEAKEKIIELLPKRTALNLRATCTALSRSIIYIVPRSIQFDTRTQENNAIPSPYRKLYSGYCWLTGTMPFYKTLTDHSSLQLLSLLRRKSVKLSELTLNNFDPHGISTLFKTLENYPYSFCLSCSRKQMHDSHLVNLSSHLQHNTNIQALSLSGNKIGTEGACALAEVLRTNNNIISLEMSFNKPLFESPDGVNALLAALKQNTGLKYLYISGLVQWSCVISSDILATLLQSNNSLMALDLDRVELDAGGIATVCNALQKNSALRVLALCTYTLNDADTDALTMLAEKPGSLETFRIHGGYHLKKELAAELKYKAEQKNRSFLFHGNLDA